MPNFIQKLFMPVFRLVHWPDPVAYHNLIQAESVEQIMTLLPRDGVHTVVEAGCGHGHSARRLAEVFERVIGFDINPHRIDQRSTENLLLVAGSAEAPPVGEGAADLVLCLSMLEHIPDRPATLRAMARMVRPGGRLVYTVPSSGWKVLQWIGFIPEKIRKELRGLMRAVTGHRKTRRQVFRPGHETNNPQRASRRRWYEKLLPRVHGEYDSNLDEFVQWSRGNWRKLMNQAELEVVACIKLSFHSPYGFGLMPLAKVARRLGLTTAYAFIVSPSPETPGSSPPPSANATASSIGQTVTASR
jgi:ubiquinone/menaquinone biosynthesis C-methylase UbiE